MFILNFAHPLIPEQLQRIEEITGWKVERVIEVNAQVDVQQSLVPQVVALADSVGLSAGEWQTLPLLVNMPSLNYIAMTLLAELHGRMGYFPVVVRLRPVAGSMPPHPSTPLRTGFEVVEVISLQAVREAARERRVESG